MVGSTPKAKMNSDCFAPEASVTIGDKFGGSPSGPKTNFDPS
jgi:hypothetical protein